MASNYPSNLDDSSTIPVESAATPLSINHVIAHQNIQDAIEAIEAKVGVDSSAVTTSHDYKLGEILTTDKAVGKTATQTLTNKTLTSPTITGATATTTSVNGVTLQTGGSATDFLAANGSYVAGSVSNASTTAKGIVEAATSAEVTAGTAIGGTGAVLAVTPDALAASTPVFSGTGITNLHKAYNSRGTISSSTTITVTCGFRPKSVTLFATGGGAAGGSGAVTSMGGYDVTSATMHCVYTAFNTSGSTWSSGGSASYALNITYGSSPTATTAIINNITSTSFDIVTTFGTTSANYSAVVTGY